MKTKDEKKRAEKKTSKPRRMIYKKPAKDLEKKSVRKGMSGND